MGPRAHIPGFARRLLQGLALLALAGLGEGCGPTLAGTCQTQADCTPTNTYCTAQGVCIAQSGSCSPTCPPGHICSNSTCVALKASLALPSSSALAARTAPPPPSERP